MIQIVDNNDEKLKSVIPALARGMLNNPDTIVAGSYDGEELLGAILFNRLERSKEFCINYIYIAEGQKSDILEELFAHIEFMATEANSQTIAVRLIGEFDKLMSLNEVLEHCNYVPINRHGKYLLYYMQDILKAEFVKKVKDNPNLTKQVYAYNELSPEQIDTYSKKLKLVGGIEEFPELDFVFGRYFVVEDKIVGYMDIKEVAEGILAMQEIQIEKSDKTKYALPQMLTAVLNTASAFLEYNSAIYLLLESESLLKTFYSVFGEAKINLNMFEYCKKI